MGDIRSVPGATVRFTGNHTVPTEDWDEGLVVRKSTVSGDRNPRSFLSAGTFIQ